MRDLMLKDLERSGLSKDDARRLQFKILTPEETAGITDRSCPSYLIPYFGTDKKLRETFRIRFLDEGKSSFNGKKGLPRYWQPSNTLPCFYFDPRVDWVKFGKDVTKPLYITEGEKKAAKACQTGITTIGLGGVWSWRSKKQGIPAIEDFDIITWKGRRVILAFDSDVSSNPMVMQALNALSQELLNRGATVGVLRLPSEPGEKVGLDDYLRKHTLKKFNDLKVAEYRSSEELWALNEEVCYINSVNAVYDLKSGYMYKTRAQFVDMAYADRNFTIADGDKMKTVNVADEWLKWPFRRSHGSLVYTPGAERVLESGDLNTWTGWGLEPKEGDIKPWLDIMDHLFGDDPKFHGWLMRWLAYPLQNPGVKMNSAVLLWSLQKGLGKSFLGYVMKDIYGGNFSAVGQQDITSSYNGWCVNKQFILGEEITGTDRRHDADKLKTMLTREMLEVSVKYQPGYQIRDCANYLFTSNHPDSMFLEAGDRRVAVYEIKGAPLPDGAYTRADKWRKAGGAAAFMHHLLHKVDVSDFNPAAKAYETASKRDMIALSKSDIDLFIQSIKDDPGSIFQVNGIEIKREIFTVEELITFYDPDGTKRTNNIAMSKALRRAGFEFQSARTKKGVKKLWAIVHPDKWSKKKGNEMAGHYDGTLVPFDKDRQKEKLKGGGK